jgi:endonuclease/exonuclease/phosphatase family metal-dependent hydrolase
MLAVVHAVGAAMASEHLRGCSCGPPWAPRNAVAAVAPAAPPSAGPALRVVSYNLHSGLGPKLAMSRPRAVVERNLRAVARVIVGDAPGAPDNAPDVVGLNEVDFAARRSGGLDQASFLAEELERRTGHAYGVVRGVTWERRTPGFEVRFGNAVLVRHPIVRSEAVRFDAGSATADTEGVPPVRSPLFLDRFVRESRGVVKATIATPTGEVDLLVTHLDAFAQAEREAQAVHLLRHVAPGRTTVLLGDLNAVPTPLTVGRRFFEDDLTHDLLTSGPLVDARVLLAARDGSHDLRAWATFPAATPVWPLDGVLGSHDLVPAAAQVIGLTESDHRGIAVDYRVTRDPDALRQARAWHDAVRVRQLAHLDGCVGDDDVHRASVAPGAHDTREDRRRRLLAASGFSDLPSRFNRTAAVDRP